MIDSSRSPELDGLLNFGPLILLKKPVEKQDFLTVISLISN
jgi:hypothetical protein